MSALKFEWVASGQRGADVNPALALKGLNIKVGIRMVLTNVSLELYPGDHVMITGPNGSGKSTLLNAIAGIEPAILESGRVIFDGHDITDLPAHVRSSLGIVYMRQVDNVFNSLTVSENLKIAIGNNGPEMFCKAFPGWAQDFSMSKTAGLLSGGQKKKLAWGMTVMRSGIKLVLLDEPRAGVKAGSFFVPETLDNCCIMEIEHNI